MDTYHKNTGEQTNIGFRPLRSGGPSRGPELTTVAYAVVGVAMGVVVGTLLASGSFNPHLSNSLQQPVQASTTVPAPATREAARPPGAALPVLKAGGNGAPAILLASVAVRQPASTVAKPTLRLVATHGRLARHRHHGRHRRFAALRTGLKTAVLSPVVDPKPAAAIERSGFSIQGSLKEAAYDPFTGTIQTYEGEQFAVDQPSSEPNSLIAWQQYPADFHYQCDESGSCSLFRSGVVLNARLMH